MTIAVPHPLSLEQFLKLPYIEGSPAWEFMNEEAIQKPMPGGKHSRLQSRLAGAINAADSRSQSQAENLPSATIDSQITQHPVDVTGSTSH